MKMLTVRLNDEDAARLAALRERGVEISSVVRDAIRKRCGESIPKIETRRNVRSVLDAIYAEHPDATGTSPGGLDLTDRRAVAAAIRKRLTRGHTA